MTAPKIGQVMWHEFEAKAGEVRATLIQLGERSPVVVATADMAGLAVWQLVNLWADHLPEGYWRDIVTHWDVEIMHDTTAALIVWAENQQTGGDFFSLDDTESLL